MPKITKPKVFSRGGVWFAQWRIDGVRKKITTGVKVGGPLAEREALAKASQLQAVELSRYSVKHEVNHRLLPASAVFALDRIRKEREGLSTSTLDQQRRYGERFVVFFGPDRVLADLTAHHIEDWRDWLLQQERDYSRATLKVSLPALKARGKVYASKNSRKKLSGKTVREHLSWLSSTCERYDVVPNPCKRVRHPKKSDIQRQEDLLFYNRDEATHLILCSQGRWQYLAGGAAPDTLGDFDGWHWHYWLVFIASTGVRIGEAQGIRVKDIDMERSLVWVTSQKTKRRRGLNLKNLGWKDDPVDLRHDFTPLSALNGLLEQARGAHGESFSPESKLYLRHSKWFYNCLRRQCERLGVPFKSVHALRHGWCSEAIKSGWPPAQIAKFMGHTNLATFYATYGHLTHEDTPEHRFADPI